jgi:hypothetical protein
MRHWDERERTDDLEPARLSRADRERLKELLEQPAHRKQRQAGIHSLIGLALSLGVLVALAVTLAPGDVVSPKLLP